MCTFEINNSDRNIGICALCGHEAKLMQSHIIPKLVYRRIRSYANSRFRSIDNFDRELQDGEKHIMLCHECEEKFSVYETWFANNVIDRFLSSGLIPTVDDCKMDDYILSVAWRILWDDLFRLNSFSGEPCRRILESFEQSCRDYFICGRKEGMFRNYVFTLQNIISCTDGITKGCLFGYAGYNPVHGAFILTYYAGLVIVTRFLKDNQFSIVMNSNTLTTFEGFISTELVQEFSMLYEKLRICRTPDFIDKISKRYRN